MRLNAKVLFAMIKDAMDKSEARQRAGKLREVIDHHRYLYHVLDKQEISDAALDALKKELFDIEQKYPELITADSPTQRVGGKPLKEFKKFKHSEPMISFNDAFGEDDMEDWEGRLERLVDNVKKDGYYCELKIDGLAVELIYERGALKVGSTRGDGIIGEDVTQNLKTVEAVPLKLLDEDEIIKNLNKAGLEHFTSGVKKSLSGTLVVRGEVFITRKDFERINKEQEKRGLKIYANPRNLAAGSVRQLDPSITRSRKMDSFAYALKTDVGQDVHEEEHLILKALGFKTNSHNKFCKDLNTVQKFRDYWEERREKLNYEVDGIVVVVNNNRTFQNLGVVGKAPRGAIAYKFAPKESETVVEDIIVQVGRTGTLTPVAVLRPVNIGGVTVSRATLHNLDEIKRLDVRLGDTVIVGRAGDVIPDIKQVIKELRTGKEKEFHMPRKCPICDSPVEQISGQVAFKCTNKNCPAIKREAVYHFVSRKAFNIDGVGPKIIDQLMEAGLIRNSADLFVLKKEDLLNLERFADKSADNTINSMQERKKVPLDRFIFALGIPHVGSETALDLARKFGTLEKLADVNLDELSRIKDVGPVMAKSIYEWFRAGYNKKLLTKFKKVGLQILKQESAQKSSKLKDLTFVFTGTLDTLSRERAEEMVRENDGDVLSSVSKETDYVVAGDDPGSKYDRAQKLGVKIISEKEFIKLINE